MTLTLAVQVITLVIGCGAIAGALFRLALGVFRLGLHDRDLKDALVRAVLDHERRLKLIEGGQSGARTAAQMRGEQ